MEPRPLSQKSFKSFGTLKGNRSNILSNSMRPVSRGEKQESSPHSFFLFNISLEEQTVLSTVKQDLQIIQEEINRFDIDGQLRSSAFVSDPIKFFI